MLSSRNAFPRVGSTDFELARVDCHKKVTRLQVSPLSPSVLKASRELNRSALYLLPKESLAEQVGEQQDGCNVNDAEEVLDSCQSLDQDDDALQAVQESHDPEMVEVADDVVEVADDVVEVADDVVEVADDVVEVADDVVEVADDVVEVADDVVEVADDFADDLHEWRALRARHDEEYLESLQTDQERGQAQRREVEVYRKRKEALERRRLNLSNCAEPQDGIPLQVKYPDGHVARRRFDLMQPIQHLFDFVGSDDMATEVFSIQRARASPIRSTTIIDHINESCTVYVTWDDVMDTDIAHILVPEEDNSPQNSSSVPLDTTAGFPNLSHVNDPNKSDLKTLLATLASKVWIGETPSCNMINVCRENLMDGAIRAFARRSFNPEAKLSVIFMDDFMQAEGSVDEGGPTREFFRLLMMALRDSALFTGPQNSKNLSLDSHALRRGLYRTYGGMIAVALVHGGVFPSFFSERLYQNLCSIPTSPPTLEEVADQDLQLKLKDQ
ncbi:uncharacterized protein LOC114568671 isoform X3 [Perca flavescens]|uniref:uncharacterized protein LOC114568671 isoform X3 n=1 Tax=Perca flavescens TaxID=8167 RepID=UPI00106EF88C|nr:uncharacterized protein LOC114568671 isoform X3 [Perca flavescens]